MFLYPVIISALRVQPSERGIRQLGDESNTQPSHRLGEGDACRYIDMYKT